MRINNVEYSNVSIRVVELWVLPDRKQSIGMKQVLKKAQLPKKGLLKT